MVTSLMKRLVNKKLWVIRLSTQRWTFSDHFRLTQSCIPARYAISEFFSWSKGTPRLLQQRRQQRGGRLRSKLRRRPCFRLFRWAFLELWGVVVEEKATEALWLTALAAGGRAESADPNWAPRLVGRQRSVTLEEKLLQIKRSAWDDKGKRWLLRSWRRSLEMRYLIRVTESQETKRSLVV